MAATAIVLAVVLVGIAVVSLRSQLRTWQRLRTESLASDDRRYLRGIAQRRTLNAVLLLSLAGMLGGAFVSGGQEELNRIIQLKQDDPQAKHTPEDEEFVRWWAIYWMTVLFLLFFIVTIAIVDYAAISRYGRRELRRIQREQRDLLERDLAVYKQQKLNDRLRGPG